MTDLSNPATVSRLHIHSYGVIAQNKALSSNVVEVTPVEDLPMSSGQLTDNAVSYTASGSDSQGQSYQESVKQTATVSATWMPMGSNRMTAPDVRKGERVMLYRFGDTDKFYWVTQGSDMNLRKLETAVYAWSGSPNESDATDANGSYFFEVSTHTKLMHVHTSKSNGELCSFDVQLNPGTGQFQMTDDIGNSFFVDAVNRIMQMQTADGAIFQLNQKNLSAVVPETFQIQAKNGIFNFSQSCNITCPTTTHKGNFNEIGAFGLNGDMTTAVGSGGGTPGTGKINIAGDMALQGNASVNGTLSSKQITSEEDIIAPNIP